IELLALGRKEQHLLRRGPLGPDRFHRQEDRLRFEHHTLAPAERAVIHGFVTIERPLAQVVNADLEQPSVAAPLDYSILKWPGEKFGEDREHVENQERFTSFNPSGNSTLISRAPGSISTQIERANGISQSSSISSRPDPPP